MRSVPLGTLLTGIDAGWSPLCSEEPPGLGQWGVLKVSAVTSGRYLPEESKALLAGHSPRPEIEVRAGDILMCRANGAKELVGATTLVRSTPPSLMLSDKILRLAPNPSVADARYLHRALISVGAKRQLATFLNGSSGQNNISQKFIRSLRIPTPDLSEQRRIAEILDAADATIDATRKVAEKLETTASALTTAQLAKLARDAPAVVPLSDVADVLSGVTLGSEPGGAGSVELPYLRVANVQDGRIDTSEMKSIRILRAELPKYLLRTGDVLLTEGGDLDKLGRGAMWDGRIPQCITQNHVFRVRCNESRVLPGYLSAYIGSPMGKAYFLKIAKQTTNLASINSTQLKALPLPVPALSDQSALIELMTAGAFQVTVERQRLAKLQTLRHGLMDDLLTGRVRVPAR
jgi:type I restriction enzyme S subunit